MATLKVPNIHGQESQVTKNTTNMLNLHGVTNFLKISRTDEVTKVARTRYKCMRFLGNPVADGHCFSLLHGSHWNGGRGSCTRGFIHFLLVARTDEEMWIQMFTTSRCPCHGRPGAIRRSVHATPFRHVPSQLGSFLTFLPL
jgi:hypothetical protein